MNILDAILSHQDGAAVQQVAQQFGLGNGEAASALSALVPQLAAGVQQNLQQPGGLQSLIAALTSGAHDQYLNDPSRLGDQATVEAGNGILGHVLGSRDASREVAATAAAQTGLSPDLLRQILPIAATLVMGALARQTSATAPGAAASAAVNPAGMMGSLTSMLDQNQDGSMVDDVMGMVGRFLGSKA